jgi:hypothetical protein
MTPAEPDRERDATFTRGWVRRTQLVAVAAALVGVIWIASAVVRGRPDGILPVVVGALMLVIAWVHLRDVAGAGSALARRGPAGSLLNAGQLRSTSRVMGVTATIIGLGFIAVGILSMLGLLT